MSTFLLPVDALLLGAGYLNGIGKSKPQRTKKGGLAQEMQRTILVLMVVAMLLVATALPALASHRSDRPEEPREPRCGWYYYEDRRWDPWWEYWCHWRGWGWEFVFWTWA